MSDSGFGSYQSLSTLSSTEPSTIPDRAESELSSPSPPLRHSGERTHAERRDVIGAKHFAPQADFGRCLPGHLGQGTR